MDTFWIKLRTFLALLLISSSTIGLTGCALFVSQPEPEFVGPLSEVFPYPYDEIWRAIQKSVSHYPIQTNNIEQGILETDVIKGDDRFVPPFHKGPLKGYRYTIHIKVVKGKARGTQSSRVDINKKVTIERDFFSGAEELKTDGYEERVLMYRIYRELQIERSIRKAFVSK